MRKLSTAVAVTGVAAVAFGSGAVALAAFSPVDTSGAISGCYSQKNGSLRVVSPGARCANGEAPLTWQQQGQPGPIGPSGAAGPAGPAGPAGRLSCADELRIRAAAPEFVVSPTCTSTPAPSPTSTTAPAAVTLTGITALSPVVIGDLAPGAQVTLSGPAAADTFVPVTSSTGVATVDGGGVTVPMGQTSAPVMLWGVAEGATTLTAALGAQSFTATATVIRGD